LKVFPSDLEIPKEAEDAIVTFLKTLSTGSADTQEDDTRGTPAGAA
jgi:hypothetical protein